MSRIADTWRSFWHAVTSNDRHANYDSPYRSGQNVPLSHSHHTPLVSVATSATKSRQDLSDSCQAPRQFMISGNNSPPSHYSPGLRSSQRVQSLDRDGWLRGGSRSGSFDKSPMIQIQMQSFTQGLPLPPPVGHSWKRIETWAEENFVELFDNICEPATNNDINELEHELDCTLPQDVRDSIQFHDGQERGGRPTGLLFGAMLLDCEEIVEEWNNWRAVNERYLMDQPSGIRACSPQMPSKALAGSSSSSSTPVPAPSSTPYNRQTMWKEELLDRQTSQPHGAVQKAYAHVSWIPLAKDWGGNCVAVDLAPGHAGNWGQIILFGRDYDCKYVIARSWSAFLASLADDMTSGPDKVLIDDESGQFKFKPFKRHGVEPPYFEILRWRCDQRHGRWPSPKKRHSAPNSPSRSGLRINSNVPSAHLELAASSPYASPTESSRDKSPNRPNGKSALINGPIRSLVSSPLARVQEESGATQNLLHRTDTVLLKRLSHSSDKFLPGDTPLLGTTAASTQSSTFDRTNKENMGFSNPSITLSNSIVDNPSVAGAHGDNNPASNAVSKASADEMKTIEI